MLFPGELKLQENETKCIWIKKKWKMGGCVVEERLNEHIWARIKTGWDRIRGGLNENKRNWVKKFIELRTSQ